MTPSKSTFPKSIEEVWHALAANGTDPDRTINPLDTRSLTMKDSTLVSPSYPTSPSSPSSPSLPITPSQLPALPLAGTENTIADFEVKGILGEGGMGRVLLARQRSLQRDVALKMLKSTSAQPEAMSTLLAEAIIAGSIEHPCVVPIHALGRDAEGCPVLVMKRIEGVSWKTLVKDSHHPMWSLLAPEDGDKLDAHLEILMSICNGVHFAHTRRIVHRDIKLDNVMIGAFGEVYLVDWGVALRLESKSTSGIDDFDAPVGTLAYMAPEMALGCVSKIDARTDVYLLGATLHAVLTGEPRHRGTGVVEVLTSARDSEPFEYGPAVPVELAAICNKAMHVEREQRFSSALELRQAIALYRRHRGSVVLGNKAMVALEEVEALLAKSGATITNPDDERRIYKKMTECRFGFMQALDAWKGNHAARAGLDRCLEHVIEHEIAQRDVEGARILLGELSQPRPDLEERIAALGTELDAAKEREKKLKAMERDFDLRIGISVQFAVLGVALICAVVGFTVIHVLGPQQPTPQALIAFAVAFLSALLVPYVMVRRRRIRTEIAKRAYDLLLMMPATVLVHRIVAAIYHVPVNLVLTTDMVILGSLAFCMAIAIRPKVIWPASVFLVGAAISTAFPDIAVYMFTACTSIAILMAVVLWVRLAQSRMRERLDSRVS